MADPVAFLSTYSWVLRMRIFGVEPKDGLLAPRFYRRGSYIFFCHHRRDARSVYTPYPCGPIFDFDPHRSECQETEMKPVSHKAAF